MTNRINFLFFTYNIIKLLILIIIVQHVINFNYYNILNYNNLEYYNGIINNITLHDVKCTNCIKWIKINNVNNLINDVNYSINDNNIDNNIYIDIDNKNLITKTNLRVNTNLTSKYYFIENNECFEYKHFKCYYGTIISSSDKQTQCSLNTKIEFYTNNTIIKMLSNFNIGNKVHWYRNIITNNCTNDISNKIMLYICSIFLLYCEIISLIFFNNFINFNFLFLQYNFLFKQNLISIDIIEIDYCDII